LQEPPILHPPRSRKPFILYLTLLEVSMGYVLEQHNETSKKEYAIYYE